MTQHHMEIRLVLGQWRWTIWSDTQNIVGTSQRGYETEKACLHALFGIFFGTWDESFLELYAKWMEESGGEYDVPPEAVAGVNVRVEPAKVVEPIGEAVSVEPQQLSFEGEGSLGATMMPVTIEKAADHGQQG
jgi:hypothetical protein